MQKGATFSGTGVIPHYEGICPTNVALGFPSLSFEKLIVKYAKAIKESVYVSRMLFL